MWAMRVSCQINPFHDIGLPQPSHAADLRARRIGLVWKGYSFMKVADLIYGDRCAKSSKTSTRGLEYLHASQRHEMH